MSRGIPQGPGKRLLSARVYVSTYRRPALLQRCLTTLRESTDLPIVLLCPPDEEHEVPPGIGVVELPPEFSGRGAGPPRYYAGLLAQANEDDVLVYTDDDVAFFPPGTKAGGHSLGVDGLVDVLAKYAGVGSIACRDPYWHGFKLWLGKVEPQLASTFCPVGVVALRMSAYQEVGGFDLNLKRSEDYDLALRLRLAGYARLSHGLVHVHHVRFQGGGLSEYEGGVKEGEFSRGYGQKRDEVADAAFKRGKEEALRYMVSKYPEGFLKLASNLSLRSNTRVADQLMAAYKLGKLVINAQEVRLL